MPYEKEPATTSAKDFMPPQSPDGLTPEAVSAAVGLIPAERSRRQTIKRAVTAAGLVAVAAYGVWQEMSQSGEYEYLPAAKQTHNQSQDHFRMASWNMHGQAASRSSQIAKLIKNHHLDALALQEVTGNDVKKLHDRLPNLNETFVLADLKQHPLDNGYGNAILSVEKPYDIKTRPLGGYGFFESAIGAVGGFADGLLSSDANASTVMSSTSNGVQETRAAIAETIKISYDHKTIPVELVTTHISGHIDRALHKRQFSQFIDFTKKNTEDDRPTVAIGDLNAEKQEVVPAFANIGFITPLTGITTVDNVKDIDHVAYTVGSDFDLCSAYVLKSPKTDHYPIVVDCPIKSTSD